jgi:hypothetical protein
MKKQIFVWNGLKLGLQDAIKSQFTLALYYNATINKYHYHDVTAQIQIFVLHCYRFKV